MSTVRSRTAFGLVAAIGLLCVAPAAAQSEAASDPVDLTEEATPEPTKPEKPDWETAVQQRRDGFTVGLIGGGMLGNAEGFPNDALKINRFDFFTETGTMGGGQGAIFIGVAAADWLVFGLGPHYGRMVSGDLDTTFYGFNFHVDVFPGFSLGGPWQDVGVTVDAGVALSNTTTFDMPDDELIESGGASRIALGAFYEGIRLWKISMGPFLSYDQIWSTSAFRPAGWLGWRTTLYAKP